MRCDVLRCFHVSHAADSVMNICGDKLGLNHTSAPATVISAETGHVGLDACLLCSELSPAIINPGILSRSWTVSLSRWASASGPGNRGLLVKHDGPAGRSQPLQLPGNVLSVCTQRMLSLCIRPA